MFVATGERSIEHETMIQTRPYALTIGDTDRAYTDLKLELVQQSIADHLQAEPERMDSASSVSKGE